LYFDNVLSCRRLAGVGHEPTLKCSLGNYLADRRPASVETIHHEWNPLLLFIDLQEGGGSNSTLC
jgi:hypothetical protein